MHPSQDDCRLGSSPLNTPMYQVHSLPSSPEEVTKLQQAEEDGKDFSFSYNLRPQTALGSAAKFWKEEKGEEEFWCSVGQVSIPLPGSGE